MSNSNDYRADIDGLRAISVLSVLIFHLSEKLLPGGFLGVDIFFVISGYLISKNISRELSKGTFTFHDFYRRRINRILPALFGVLLFTLVIAALFFLPLEFKRVANSVIEVITYKANYYFAKDYDYFSPLTSEIPLLHLWSLSVEEQFYFILPGLMLLMSKKLTASRILLTFFGLIVISTGVGEFYLFNGNPKLAYYSIFSRASELLVGTLIALAPFTIQKRAIAEATSLFGFLILILCLQLFSAVSRFPGFLALIPCLAAAAIIFANQNFSTWIGRILSNRILVFIGLISYSLYLYHWPIMAAVRYATSRSEFTFATGLLITIASFGLATASWHFIEKPFRRNHAQFKIVLKRNLLIPTGVTAALAIFVTSTKGLPERYGQQSDLLTQSLEYLSDKYCHIRFDSQNCRFGNNAYPSRTLLLGDSHAGHYQPVFDELGKNKNFSFIARSNDACPPLVKFNGTESLRGVSADCEKQTEWTKDIVDQFDIFIFAANWSTYAKKDESYFTQLKNSVRELKARNKKVVFVEQIPDCKGVTSYYRKLYSPQRILSNLEHVQKEITSTCGQKSQPANLFMQEFAKETGTTFIRPISEFLSEESFFEHGFLYKDDTHLNQKGGYRLGKWLSANSKEVLKIVQPDVNTRSLK